MPWDWSASALRFITSKTQHGKPTIRGGANTARTVPTGSSFSSTRSPPSRLRWPGAGTFAIWTIRPMAWEGTEFAEIIGEAELFLNVSGGSLLRDAYMPCRRKVLIDTDPGWNHFRNYPRWDAVPDWHDISHGYRAHDYFFTYAERIGQPGCILPSMGLTWQSTRPPVVLDCWQPRPPGADVDHGDDLEELSGSYRISRRRLRDQRTGIRAGRCIAFARNRGPAARRRWQRSTD